MSNTTIQLKKSGQTGNTPADLIHGELAINYADGKLFYKNGVGIKSIENQKTFSTINANNSLIIATSPTDILSLVAGSNILIDTNTVTKTVTISVPGGSSIDTLARERSQAAYDEANTQNVINQTQNTWITDTNTFAQAAYNKANGASISVGTTGVGNVISNVVSNVTGINFDTLTGFNVTDLGSGNVKVSLGSTFKTWKVDGQTNLVAVAEDTVRFGAANGIVITTDPLSDPKSITFSGYPIFSLANTASSNTIYLQGVDDTQNTSIQAINNLASSAYDKANNSSSNTVALQSVNDLQNTNITAVNAFTQASYNAANAGINLSASAYSQANTASGNTIALQAQMTTINTNITSVNTFAGSSYVAANTAAANTVYLQTINNNQNTNIAATDTLATAAYGKANAEGSINTTQNTAIAAGNTFAWMASYTANAAWIGANTANGNISALQAQMTTTNTNITSVNTFAGSAFNSANAGVTLATSAYGQANNASGNTVALQAVNNAQNTNITALNTYATAAYGQANNENSVNQTQNTWITNTDTLARAAYGKANAEGTINSTQNTNISSVNTFSWMVSYTANAAWVGANTANTNVASVNTLATAAYDKANAEGTINSTQNTWITNTNTFAQSAYNTANTKFNNTGGTVTGNVTVQNNLVVQGNLTVLGNSTTITTGSLSISDPLIFLANGNFVSDAVDIGLVGHYGGPLGETHTGIFRDPNLKEWIVFQGYTTQVQSNNLINIADPTFAYANLYANVVKSNLISTYAVVNGLNVFSTMTSSFNSANAAITLATAAYGKANAEGTINSIQNTNITSVNTFAGSAFNSANAGVTLATAAYAQANNASGNTVALQSVNATQNTNISSINTFAGSAFNSANAGVTLATAAYAQANNASGNTVALQEQMTTTNTNISSVNTYAWMASWIANSAWTSANAGVSLAAAAYGKANAEGTINTTQNTAISAGNTYMWMASYTANAAWIGANTANTNVASVNTLATSAYGKANAEGTINTTQNTAISAGNTFSWMASFTANSAWTKANGAVQTGFTAISANSVSVTPSSNADTLTITPGTGISILANNTTKTITISSTSTGSGSGAITFAANPPASGNTVGDRWIDSEDGTEYTYVSDGNSFQWVEFALSTSSATNLLGGSINALVYQTSIGNTGFISAGSQNNILTAGPSGLPIWKAQTDLSIANTQITGLITSGQIATVANTQITGTISPAQISTSGDYQIDSLGVGTAASGTTGEIRAANNITAYFSDKRLKTNIRTIDGALEKLNSISGVYYNANEIAEKYGYTDTSEQVGVIAQEVQSILPHVVKSAPFDTGYDDDKNEFSISGENYLTVQYEKLIPLLIQAIKEQQTQIEELKGKINAH